MTPSQTEQYARALKLTKPVSRRRLYCATRAVFVTGFQQVPAFDKVFGQVFGGRKKVDQPRRLRRRDRGGRRRAGRQRDARGHGRAEHHGARGRPGCDADERRRGRERGRGGHRGGEARPAAGGQRGGGAQPQELPGAQRRGARPALQAHGPPAARHARAGVAPQAARSPRRAHGHAPHAAQEPAHRRRPDRARPQAPALAPAPARPAVRHLGLDGALRARVPAVPARRPRDGPLRRGVRLRHAPDAADQAARRAQPAARDPPRDGGGAGLVQRHADRRRAEARSTTATAAAGWRAARSS